jgi:hypothetical protein
MRGHRLLCALGLATLSMQVSAQVILITEEESKFPNAQTLSTRAITRGPAIKLLSPTEVSAKQFAIKLNMEARGGAKIDATSLKVEYLKQPLVDLTARFKAGLQGAHIELPQVKVPEGQHDIRVSIKDSEGREGSHTFQLRAK